MILQIVLSGAMVALSAPAQGEDKIGAAKAPEILKKINAELAKRSGFHVAENIDFPTASVAIGVQGNPPLEGVVKKDFAVLKGKVEAYCKGAVTLLKSETRFLEPKDMKGVDAVIGASIRNPAVILADLFRFALTAQFAGDVKLDTLDCRIAEVRADANTTEDQLKELTKLIPPPKENPSYQIIVLNDKKKSSSVYKAWISKDTLLIQKVEWALTMVIDQKKTEGFKFPEKVEIKYGFSCKDYDKDLEVDLPKEIRARFGLKDEKKK